MRTWSASRSRLEYTATVPMPISRHVRMTRTAISPRLAMRILSSTLGFSSGERVLHNCTRLMVCAMWAGDWEIRRFAEIDSTNTYVLDQARQGAAEGLVAVAEHQTAGRGRLDRRWESPPGTNLLASVLLRPGCEADDVHLCTGVVALAAADACAEAAGVEPVLKWPNDLLVGEAKLAGVLAEAEFDGTRLSAVVVGIGLNVAWPGPAGAGGTCLNEAGGTAQPVDKSELLERMLEGLARRRPL